MIFWRQREDKEGENEIRHLSEVTRIRISFWASTLFLRTSI